MRVILTPVQRARTGFLLNGGFLSGTAISQGVHLSTGSGRHNTAPECLHGRGHAPDAPQPVDGGCSGAGGVADEAQLSHVPADGQRASLPGEKLAPSVSTHRTPGAESSSRRAASWPLCRLLRRVRQFAAHPTSRCGSVSAPTSPGRAAQEFLKRIPSSNSLAAFGSHGSQLDLAAQGLQLSTIQHVASQAAAAGADGSGFNLGGVPRVNSLDFFRQLHVNLPVNQLNVAGSRPAAGATPGSAPSPFRSGPPRASRNPDAKTDPHPRRSRPWSHPVTFVMTTRLIFAQTRRAQWQKAPRRAMMPPQHPVHRCPPPQPLPPPCRSRRRSGRRAAPFSRRRRRSPRACRRFRRSWPRRCRPRGSPSRGSRRRRPAAPAGGARRKRCTAQRRCGAPASQLV